MAGNHPRNTGPMQDAPRCGARTRSGASCAAPRVAGAGRCRMHGGKGSGAPIGNRNAWKKGLYSREMLEREKAVAQLRRDARELLKALSDIG